jgi:t-SNARE complex subunit (syntaxin)
MQDRISELSPSIQAEKSVVIDIGADDMNEEEQAFMPEFFAEIGNIKTSMSLIRKNIKTIQDIYDKQPWSSLESSQHGKIEELEELLSATNAAAGQVRAKLKEMKESNDQLASEDAQKRIRSNLQSVLAKKFLALLQDYQALQTAYRDKSRERFQRQAEIVQPGVTREQVDTMLESGGDYFGDKLLSEKRHTEAKNALMAIQEQQRDLKHLEKSIHELHQLFLDMEVMVDSSTETMEKVEMDLAKTVQVSSVAINELKKAEEYTMQRRRKFTILATGIGTVVLVIVIVVVAVIAAKYAAFS